MLVVGLSGDGTDGELVRKRLRGERLSAPFLVDVEVASMLRRHVFADRLTTEQGRAALADLAALPLTRVPHVPLLSRMWELRANVTAYDGAYVALAERLACTLVTVDARLSRASGPRCDIEVLAVD